MKREEATDVGTPWRRQRPLPFRRAVEAMLSRPLAVAAAVYALVSIVVLAPIVGDLDGVILHEPGDLSSTARDYWAANEHGATPFTFSDDRLLQAPEGLERAPALHWANPVQPVFATLFRHAFGWVGALNVYLLLGLFLSALLTFHLLRKLGVRTAPALLGGFAFGFGSWQWGQALYGHVGLNHGWIFPVLTLALMRLRRRRDYPAAVVAGLSLALAFYLFSYLGLIASLLVGVFMLCDLVWRTDGSSLSRILYTDAVCWAAAYAALIPALLAPRYLPDGFTESFFFDKESFFGARLTDYLLPSAHHPLLAELFDADIFPSVRAGESALYLGLGLAALATVGVITAFGSRRQGVAGDGAFAARFALVLVPIAYVMSLPAYANVAGHRTPLPNAAFVIGSFVNWWKIYTRFGVLVLFAASLLAALGADAILRWRRGRLLLALAACLVVFESLPGVPAPTYDLARTPSLTAWLAAHPGGIVAHYPMEPWWRPLALAARPWSEYTWHVVYDQTNHGHPLFATPSISTTGEARPEAIRLASVDLTASTTGRILAAERVRYVVVHDDIYRDLRQRPPRLDPSQYRLVARRGFARVYEVRARRGDIERLLAGGVETIARGRGLPSAQASVALGNGFGVVEDYYGAPARWMQDRGRIRADVVAAQTPQRYRLILRGFSNGEPRRVALRDSSGAVLAETTVATSDALYEFPPIRIEGPTDLVLTSSPGATSLGAGDSRTGSIFVIALRAEMLPY